MSVSGTQAAAAPPRRWQRFTTAERLARFAVYLGVVLAVVTSLRMIEVIPEFLLDAPEQMQDLLARMWPIAWSHYPQGVHDALIDTLHIATLGTILAVAMALPIGVAAAPNVVPNRAVNLAARLLLVSSRSVNSLVWALLFVAVAPQLPIGWALLPWQRSASSRRASPIACWCMLHLLVNCCSPGPCALRRGSSSASACCWRHTLSSWGSSRRCQRPLAASPSAWARFACSSAPRKPVRPNMSFNRTRYGSRRKAAPGHTSHRPSAALRRLPTQAG